jgi:hypothetical protein
MKKQLNLEEQLMISGLIGQYQNIHNQINDIESKINSLSELQKELTDSLDKTRGDEKDFGNYLKNKYGPGKLDTITLEYITE